jgi:hypothetical protein
MVKDSKVRIVSFRVEKSTLRSNIMVRNVNVNVNVMNDIGLFPKQSKKK